MIRQRAGGLPRRSVGEIPDIVIGGQHATIVAMMPSIQPAIHATLQVVARRWAVRRGETRLYWRCGDLGIRLVSQDVVRKNLPLGGVEGRVGCRPRERLRVVPTRGAALHQELGYTAAVQVFLRGGVGGRTK